MMSAVDGAPISAFVTLPSVPSIELSPAELSIVLQKSDPSDLLASRRLRCFVGCRSKLPRLGIIARDDNKLVSYYTIDAPAV